MTNRKLLRALALLATAMLPGLAHAAPGLQWSTFVGGSNSENSYGVTTDGNGDIYVVGSTGSTNYPTTPGVVGPAYVSTNDVVVTKLKSDGTTVLWSTYLAGSGNDDGKAIAVDAAGYVYVAGNTASTNFPVTAGAHRTTHAGGISDGFVAKLSPSGTQVIWCTYLGGNWDDYPRGMAVDGSGNVVVAGSTNSLDYPVTAGVVKPVRNPSLVDGADGFITKLNSSGTGLVWSTFFGSDGGTDNIFGIALDSSGRPTVVGWTLSPTFPTTSGAFDRSFALGREGFVTRLNATATGYVYSTFISASGNDECLAVGVDASGYAYVTGKTSSTDFPTTASATQRTFAGGSYDAFGLKLSPNGDALTYSTYIGGSGTDIGYGACPGASGAGVFTGSTDSGNLPVTTGAYDASANGSTDVFVTSVLGSGAFGYSTYVGSSGAENGQAVAVRSNGHVVIAGQTTSSGYPTSVGAYDRTHGGGSMNDNVVTVVELGTSGSVAVEPGPTPTPTSPFLEVTMAPAQPNPHRDRTTIRFTLRSQGRVTLVVRDLQGRLVRALADEELSAGSYSRDWDGMADNGLVAPGGVYFVQLRHEDYLGTQRIARVR